MRGGCYALAVRGDYGCWGYNRTKNTITACVSGYPICRVSEIRKWNLFVIKIIYSNFILGIYNCFRYKKFFALIVLKCNHSIILVLLKHLVGFFNFLVIFYPDVLHNGIVLGYLTKLLKRPLKIGIFI